ncbi:MAG: Rrf2 family transcriptional regulator [Candidatus Kapabacteria bacterium]|nr:Rrf2 family transcriptional regulator [Candidatus Kapabacteria bacterium]
MAALSKSCLYGILATSYLSVNTGKDKKITVSKIAEDLGISFHYLAKIIQTLSFNGIVKTKRGANGGIELARDANQITVSQVIDSLDNPKFDMLIVDNGTHLKEKNSSDSINKLYEKFIEMYKNSTIREFSSLITLENN